MEQFAISANLESAAARGNQGERLDALAELKNFGRQTDGLRRVVSDDAVFDRYFGFHRELLSEVKAIGAAEGGQGVRRVCACQSLGRRGDRGTTCSYEKCTAAARQRAVRRQSSGR